MSEKGLGILGGTFDPIHLGHLHIAEAVYDQIALDEIVFIPAFVPPHKLGQDYAPAQHRYAMTELAVRSFPHFTVSDMELRRSGVSYTIDTLRELHELYPERKLYFIIGADSLFAFEVWKEPGRICKACTLVVAVRNHTSSDELNREIKRLSEKYEGNFARLDTMNIDVSSHQIRQWISDEKSLKYYVPDKVISYMKENGIYRKKEV